MITKLIVGWYTAKVMRNTKLPELSLFFPAYNEGENITSTIVKAAKVLPEVAKKYEILVVNDGSKDNTGKVVEGLMKKYKFLRMITHSPNRGYGGALKTGFAETKYDLVVFTDSDGQFDFTEVKKLISKFQETDADLVIGYRIKRSDPPKRLLIANLLKLWNLFWFGMWFKDTDCGFKLIRRRVLNEIGPLKSNGGIISTEFLAKVKRADYKYEQVGVHHYPRMAGRSTGDSLNVISKAIKETLTIWYDINISQS